MFVCCIDKNQILEVKLNGSSFLSVEEYPTKGPESNLAYCQNEEKRRTVTTGTGRDSNRSRSPYNHIEQQRAKSDEVEPKTDVSRAVPVASDSSNLEKPGFKTREEFQRDFERRERELKEVLSRPRVHSETVHESLGTTTRSDPGGMLDDEGSKWEYRVSDHMDDFQRLEPEPAYPHERLRYSRSKSDTDLVALSPTDSQRYSSPMQPGNSSLNVLYILRTPFELLTR